MPGSGPDRGPCCTSRACRSRQSPRRSRPRVARGRAGSTSIARHDLTLVQVGRRADLPPGSSAADVADDYAAVIREKWGSAVGVMGISTGGHYAQWLAIRHPELVDRLVLGFTAHRVPDDVKVRQRRAVDHFLAGQWRQGWALFGPWALPGFRAWRAPHSGSSGRTSAVAIRTCASWRSTPTRTTPTTRPPSWATSAARRWSHPAAVTPRIRPTSSASSSPGFRMPGTSSTQRPDIWGRARSSPRTRVRSWAARVMIPRPL